MDWLDLKTIYTIFHLFGVAIGAGGAFLSDVFFLVMTKDKILDKSELRILKTGSVATWLGLLLLIISGFLLFTTNPSGYLSSSKFIAKMIVVGILTLNGLVFHIVHIPKLQLLLGKKLSTSEIFIKNSRVMYISGAISIVSWTTALVLGGLRTTPFSVLFILTFYTLLLAFAITVAEFKRKKYLEK